MFSLVYSSDAEEYYICKSKNIIKEEDGICLVAFRAKLILNDCASKENLYEIQKCLKEGSLVHVQIVDDNTEEAVEKPASDNFTLEDESYGKNSQSNIDGNSDFGLDNNAIIDNDGNIKHKCELKTVVSEPSLNIVEKNENTHDKQTNKHSRILHLPLVVKMEENGTLDAISNDLENQNDADSIQKSRHYPLRERSGNYERFIQEIQMDEKSHKKYLYCKFCKKNYANSLTSHLERMHSTEEEVKTFMSLPKDSSKRKKIISEITRQGRLKFYFNKRNDDNDKKRSKYHKSKKIKTKDIRNMPDKIEEKIKKKVHFQNEVTVLVGDMELGIPLINDSYEMRESLQSMLNQHINCSTR